MPSCPWCPSSSRPTTGACRDSTPILEAMETEHPEPSIHPDDPTAAFVSVLLEEWGDEWGNKWMFHYRWARPVDQESGARRLAQSRNPDADEGTLKAMTAPGQGADGPPCLVRRLERTDGPPDRAVVPRHGRPDRSPPRRPRLPVRRPARVRGLRRRLPDAPGMDRSDARRPARRAGASNRRLGQAPGGLDGERRSSRTGSRWRRR